MGAPADAAGKLCGDREIQGEVLKRIPGKLPGCGIKNPVRVMSVAGIPLSQPATLNCQTAQTLKDWVKEGLIPGVGRYGGGVSQIEVAAHYSCRTRNNQPGAKVSEHGKGNAIDIRGFALRNGETLAVLDGWGKGRKGRILKKLHAAACGPFGTVLGPNSDRYHKDHFHFDTANYRGGSYCR